MKKTLLFFLWKSMFACVLFTLLATGTIAQSSKSETVKDAPAPHETWELTADIEYLGETASGQAYVYLAEGHTSVEKPYIVIEGIDMNNDRFWEGMYELLNQESFLEDLRADGFDLIVLNFDESTDYIQKNAFLAVKLIQEVNNLNLISEPVIIGTSMGGLVARYALMYMENNGMEHNMRNFICFDSPNQGANIPLGIQFWIDFFSEMAEPIADFKEKLLRPAVKQMLVYHYANSSETTAACDELFTDFFSELETMGNYPSNTRVVAISNGSGQTNGQGYESGEQLISYEYNSMVEITGNIWAVPEQTYGQIFEGYLNLITSTDELDVFMENTLPYDNAPGGYRATMAELASVGTGGFGEIIAMQNNHNFIPVISSLNIETDDLFYNISNDPNIYEITPFDSIYYPEYNESHVSISPESKEWFIGELNFGITTDIPNLTEQKTIIFPNPSNGIFYVNSEACETKILNQNGQIIFKKYYNSEGIKKIDISNFPSGIYFVKVTCKEFTKVEKLLLKF